MYLYLYLYLRLPFYCLFAFCYSPEFLLFTIFRQRPRGREPGWTWAIISHRRTTTGGTCKKCKVNSSIAQLLCLRRLRSWRRRRRRLRLRQRLRPRAQGICAAAGIRLPFAQVACSRLDFRFGLLIVVLFFSFSVFSVFSLFSRIFLYIFFGPLACAVHILKTSFPCQPLFTTHFRPTEKQPVNSN